MAHVRANLCQVMPKIHMFPGWVVPARLAARASVMNRNTPPETVIVPCPPLPGVAVLRAAAGMCPLGGHRGEIGVVTHGDRPAVAGLTQIDYLLAAQQVLAGTRACDSPSSGAVTTGATR